MRKTYFFEKKTHFLKKLVFFKQMRFSHIFVMPTPALWVSMRSPRHCGRVDTQHGGVQSVFRWLRAHLKKKQANFAIFKKTKNAVTQPKMFESAQNQSHPTRLSKTYFHSEFQLIWSSNGRENPKNTLFC